MYFKKAAIGFILIGAFTLNLGFVYGDIDNPLHHNLYEFYLVIVINLLAMVLKMSDKSAIGSILLASSFVAIAQLLCAALLFSFIPDYYNIVEMKDMELLNSGLSMATGALAANFVSVVLIIVETSKNRNV
jgi:pheromone shutdown protein TraB